MNETQAIIEAWERVRQTGETAYLATVVRTSGSTYRRPGARMLFTNAGWIAGSISGGCLEADMLQTAQQRTEHGAALVTYDSTAHEDIVWGFGLGCDGVVEALLERLPTADSLANATNSPANSANSLASVAEETLTFLQTCLNRRDWGMIATVLRVEGQALLCVGDRLLLHANGECGGNLADSTLRETLISDLAQQRKGLAQGRQQQRAFYQTYSLPNACVEVGFESVLPSAPLVVFGVGQDALPVVHLAKELGWHVTVADPRCTLASATRFAAADEVIGCVPDAIAEKLPLNGDTFTLLMTHNFLHDAALLGQLLASPVRYIGVLGPKKRLSRLIQHLQDEGMTLTDADMERLHGPVGLDIGADNPDEIALSIVSELQAARAGRTGGMLRERTSPLHVSDAPAHISIQ